MTGQRYWYEYLMPDFIEVYRELTFYLLPIILIHIEETSLMNTSKISFFKPDKEFLDNLEKEIAWKHLLPKLANVPKTVLMQMWSLILKARVNKIIGSMETCCYRYVQIRGGHILQFKFTSFNFFSVILFFNWILTAPYYYYFFMLQIYIKQCFLNFSFSFMRYNVIQWIISILNSHGTEQKIQIIGVFIMEGD